MRPLRFALKLRTTGKRRQRNDCRVTADSDRDKATDGRKFGRIEQVLIGIQERLHKSWKSGGQGSRRIRQYIAPEPDASTEADCEVREVATETRSLQQNVCRWRGCHVELGVYSR